MFKTAVVRHLYKLFVLLLCCCYKHTASLVFENQKSLIYLFAMYISLAVLALLQFSPLLQSQASDQHLENVLQGLTGNQSNASDCYHKMKGINSCLKEVNFKKPQNLIDLEVVYNVTCKDIETLIKCIIDKACKICENGAEKNSMINWYHSSIELTQCNFTAEKDPCSVPVSTKATNKTTETPSTTETTTELTTEFNVIWILLPVAIVLIIFVILTIVIIYFCCFKNDSKKQKREEKVGVSLKAQSKKTPKVNSKSFKTSGTPAPVLSKSSTSGLVKTSGVKFGHVKSNQIKSTVKSAASKKVQTKSKSTVSVKKVQTKSTASDNFKSTVKSSNAANSSAAKSVISKSAVSKTASKLKQSKSEVKPSTRAISSVVNSKAAKSNVPKSSSASNTAKDRFKVLSSNPSKSKV